MDVNRKGQALVEFVLILPIMILIIFTIYDFGNLLNSKNKLENTSTDIARLVRNGDTIEQIKNNYPKISITIKDDGNNYKKIEVQEEIKIITPFLDKILGNPCKIKTERTIKNKRNENSTEG